MSKHWLTPYWTQTKYDCIKLARMPVYLIALLSVPPLFYLSIGSNSRIPATIEGIPTRLYLLATLGTFATFGIALFGSGVGAAIERGQGWTRTLRPAPISPLVPIIGKLLANTAVTTLAVLLLMLEATLVFGVSLPFRTISLLLLTVVGCSLPLCSFGLALGSFVGPNSAPILMIILYLFMSSVSGIVVPMQMVAKGNQSLAEIAPLWPTYHAGQLALAVVRPALVSAVLTHASMLAILLLLSLLVAALARRWKSEQVVG